MTFNANIRWERGKKHTNNMLGDYRQLCTQKTHKWMKSDTIHSQQQSHLYLLESEKIAVMGNRVICLQTGVDSLLVGLHTAYSFFRRTNFEVQYNLDYPTFV